jgi:hypothetical protein
MRKGKSFNESIKEAIKNEWKKSERLFPLRQNGETAEYCKNLLFRAVFSENMQVLDIEEMSGENIRITLKVEAEWLMDILKKYLKEVKE